MTFEKEKNLFSLDDTIYLYDLTPSYFEGDCLLNPQVKRGYLRDKRFDAKQVLLGLVIDRDGFPKAHEIFPGNRKNSTTLDEMLDILERRVGKRKGATVVVDRGMAFEDNINEIKEKGYHYIVATRQAERDKYLDEFEKGNFHPLLRSTSATNPSLTSAFLEKNVMFMVVCESVQSLHLKNAMFFAGFICRFWTKPATQNLLKLEEETEGLMKPYPSYKESGVEWIGDIPSGWEVSRIKFIISHNELKLSEQTDPDYEINYIEMGDVKNQRIVNMTIDTFKNIPVKKLHFLNHLSKTKPFPSSTTKPKRLTN